MLPEARAIYTISANVSRRLLEHCGIASVPLHHPPPGAQHIRGGEYGNYILFPSRINSVKRQALAIEALSYTRRPVHIAFLGVPDTPDYGVQLQRKAAANNVDTRLTWLGAVTEEKKLELYSGCRAVFFPPLDEDYG